MIDWDKLAKRFPGCEITRGTVGELVMPGSWGIPTDVLEEDAVRFVVPARPPLSEAVHVLLPLPKEMQQVLDTKDLAQRFVEALGWSLIPPRPTPDEWGEATTFEELAGDPLPPPVAAA